MDAVERGGVRPRAGVLGVDVALDRVGPRDSRLVHRRASPPSCRTATIAATTQAVCAALDAAELRLAHGVCNACCGIVLANRARSPRDHAARARRGMDVGDGPPDEAAREDAAGDVDAAPGVARDPDPTLT